MGRHSSPRVEHTWNYLHNRQLVHRLVEQAGIDAGDVVIEIGPGKGIITDALAARAAHVIAIEKHGGTTAWLQRHLAGRANVTVFPADILEFPLPATRYKVFSSIPFNITTAIVAKLTSGTAPPAESYLVMQAEAADRLMGVPRTTMLSACLHPRFAIAVEHRFARRDFRPAPAVDCVLVRIAPRDIPLVAPEQEALYRDVVTVMFTAWKPTMREALRSLFPAAVADRCLRNVPEIAHRKPGDVAPRQWVALFDALIALDQPDLFRKVTGAERRLQCQQANLQKEHRSRTSPRRGAVKSRRS